MMASRRNQFFAAVLCAALLAVCVLPAAPSFAQNFRIIPPGGGAGKAPHTTAPFTHWDLREMPDCEVPWVMGTAAVPDLDGNGTPNEPADRAVAQNVFAAAYGVWDAVTPSELGFNNVGPGAPAGGFATDGFNTLSFSPTALGAGTNAATVVVRSASTGVIQEADIVFNSTADSIPSFGVRVWVMQADGDPCDADLDYDPTGNWPTPADGDTDHDGDGVQELEIDLGTVAIHEIGHWLGLAHIVPLGGETNVAANAIMEELWTVGIGPTGSGHTNLTLGDPDTDGDNFLYNPDLGDAPDPWMGVVNEYPSVVHEAGTGRKLNGINLDGKLLGAEHIFGIKPRQAARNWTYEWLGRSSGSNVTGECEANIVDRDPADDGVTFYPNPPMWGRRLTVTAWMRYANDNVGNRHDYGTLGPLFANVWIDLNQNCNWEPGERVVFASRTPASPGGANAVGLTVARGSVLLPPAPPDPDEPMWVRGRLDWRENVGAAGNIDGTLAGPAGAAQFGEVEDYPIGCRPRYHQSTSPNTTGVPRDGICMVYVGPPSADGQNYSALVDDGDCPLGIGTASEVYMPSADETVVQYVPPLTGVPEGGSLHTGRCVPTTEPPVTVVRKYWTPLEGPPSIEDYIPTTHCEAFPVDGAVRVVVGAPNDSVGGVITGEAGSWNDSIQVQVSFRVAPEVLPLEALSPCDPAYAALPQVPVGGAFITPEDPFTFDLQIPNHIGPDEFLIVEVQSQWSVNANQNAEITEFLSSLGDGATGIEDGQGPPLPSRLDLYAYPNPFNPGTTVQFELPSSDLVTLRVYDVRGRLVRTILAGARYDAGAHHVDWDGRDDSGRNVASGVYFLRVQAGDRQATRKLVILR